MYPYNQQGNNTNTTDQPQYTPTHQPQYSNPPPHAILPPDTRLPRDFNRDYFDFADPLENAGFLLGNNNFSDSYPVGINLVEEISSKLYTKVLDGVRSASLSNQAVIEDVAFRDVKAPNELPRRYLIIRRETIRRTHVTAYVTFLPFGEHLYFNIKTFLLGPINWTNVLVSLIPILIYTQINNQYNSPTINTVLLSLLVAGYIIFHKSTIASLRHGDSIQLALRKRFSKQYDWSTFGSDDALMFYKSVIPMILRLIQGVFEEYDIPITVIQDYLRMVSNSTNIIVQGGGSFNNSGNIVTGTDNEAKATTTVNGSGPTN
jgi:hypothetical protein